MSHFSRFGNGYSQSVQQRPMTDGEILAAAPSVFAASKHDSRSERYAYVPTSDVLTGLRREGFEPFSAAQSRCRIAGKSDFTKHMLRLRQAANIGKAGAEIPEIILLNSHDGTSSYQMMAGMFRFVCCNGMIAGDMRHNVKVPHKGDVAGRVIEGAFEVLKDFDALGESVETMKSIQLAPAEQVAFATAAIETRWDTSEAPAPIDAGRLLSVRRHEDKTNDLWTTFNRVQENLIQGGIRGRATTGRRMTTREVTGIDANVKTNRALWVLAEQMAALKSA